MPAKTAHARDRFSPGQVWYPRRGRTGPPLEVVNVHRVDRLVEVIDAKAVNRLGAKRTLMRFSDLRTNYRLEPDAVRDPGRSAA